jgi:glycosyltransferase involved in cell wall biosynthesis
VHRPVVLHVVSSCSADDPTAWLIPTTTAHRPLVVLTGSDVRLPAGPAPDLRTVVVAADSVGPVDDRLLVRVLAKAFRFGWKARPALVHAHSPAVAPLAAGLARMLRRPWLLTVSDPNLTAAQLALAGQAAALLTPQAISEMLTQKLLVRSGCIIALPGASSLGSRAADLDSIYQSVARGERPVLPGPLPDWEPLVSVIVPTYNRRQLLVRALDALDAQTYPHRRMEVVVVDDQSTDDTSGVVAARQADYVLRLVRPASKGYAAGARNSGLAVATGEIVAFTDDDCRPEPTWLAGLVGGFRDGVDIVQGRTVPDPEQQLGPWSRSQWTPYEYGLYETANIAYRRTALDAAGNPTFDPEIPAALVHLLGERLGSQAFGEDSDLAWRVRRQGGGTRFSADAVVRHHVFEHARRYLIRRSILTAGFPMLVGKVPELRTDFLWHQVFLTRRHALTTLAGIGLVITPWWPPAVAAAAPYLYSAVSPSRPGRVARAADLPLTLMRDAIEVVSCVYGSARARHVVL